MNDNQTKPVENPWKRRFTILFVVTVIIPLVVALWLLRRFGEDVPVDHESVGRALQVRLDRRRARDRAFPYWIWQRACPTDLRRSTCPAPATSRSAWSSRRMPTAATATFRSACRSRRYLGDRSRLRQLRRLPHRALVRYTPDCSRRASFSACRRRSLQHEGLRGASSSECAADPRFSQASTSCPRSSARAASSTCIDRYLVYPVAIAIMRDRLLALARTLRLGLRSARRGARGGSTPSTRRRCIFNFPMAHLPDHEGARRTGGLSRRSGTAAPAQGTRRRRAHAAALGRQQHPPSRSATRAPPSAPARRRRRSTWRESGRVEDLAPGRHAARLRPFLRHRPAARGARRAALPAVLRRLSRCLGQRLQRRACRQGGADGRDRHRPPAPRLVHLHPGRQPGDALRRLSVALHALPEDARLRQHATRRALAAGAVPAQRIGPQPARPARTGGEAARRSSVRGNDVYDPVRVGFVSDRSQVDRPCQRCSASTRGCRATPTPATKGGPTAPNCPLPTRRRWSNS
jgi:hypothetical protein